MSSCNDATLKGSGASRSRSSMSEIPLGWQGLEGGDGNGSDGDGFAEFWRSEWSGWS